MKGFIVLRPCFLEWWNSKDGGEKNIFNSQILHCKEHQKYPIVYVNLNAFKQYLLPYIRDSALKYWRKLLEEISCLEKTTKIILPSDLQNLCWRSLTGQLIHEANGWVIIKSI
jgi:hypothetical protein